MSYNNMQFIDLDPGTPIANAVRRAGEAAALGDSQELDSACGTAVDLAASAGRELWVTLAADHVAKLLDLSRVPLALTRCDQYLLQSAGWGDALRAMRARILQTDSGSEPLTERLHRATALRQRGRAHEAADALARAVGADGDPAWNLIVLWELLEILRVACRDGAEDDQGSDHAEQQPGSPDFADRVQRTRRLIADDRLREATNALVDLRQVAESGNSLGLWHVAVAELWARRLSLSKKDNQVLADVAVHLVEAARNSTGDPLVGVRVQTLRLLGRLSRERGDDDLAEDCLAEAAGLEEGLASRNLDEDLRAHLLQSVPTEHDELIDRMAEKCADVDRNDERAAQGIAALAAAMEAAHGTTIMEQLNPGEANPGPPSPLDPPACLRWVKEIADRLPRAQVIWMCHATCERIHHVLLGRGLTRYRPVVASRVELAGAVDELVSRSRSLSTPDWGDHGEQDEFDLLIQRLCSVIEVSSLVQDLPSRTRRLAIVASGSLSRVPFAAMSVSSGDRLGLRYALSDLPCLSSGTLLRRRSRGMRRGPSLLARPLSDATVPWYARTHTRSVLEGGDATVERLSSCLEQRPYTLVRVDSRGHHDHRDPSRSWLQLTPAPDDDGRLTPERLWSMNLRNCGTIALPVSEPGLSPRIGAEERTGITRAALHAGASAVLGARWPVEEPVARYLLDRFEWYARYLPRDVALTRARRDLHNQVPGGPVTVSGSGHPARWASWTLFGDSGFQPRTRWPRRAVRALLAWWKLRLDQRR